MNDSYFYTVFGFHIQSKIPLSGLMKTSYKECADVIMDYGKADSPDPEDGQITQKQNFLYNGRAFYVRVPFDIAAFSVHKRPTHTEVRYELWKPEKEQTALTWFYGIVLSAILHLNDSFAMHASGVLYQEQLHLFCGNSGMGKSTLAAGLRSRGFALFTDDKCVLRWSVDQSCNIASPSLPIMRLWDNALNAIAHEDFLADPIPVIYKSQKSQFRIQETALTQDPKRLKAIYILAKRPADTTLAYQKLKGIDKLLLLQQMVFRVEMVEGFGRKKQLWNFLEKLVQFIPVYLLFRPVRTPIPQFADYVAQLIQNET